MKLAIAQSTDRFDWVRALAAEAEVAYFVVEPTLSFSLLDDANDARDESRDEGAR